MHTHLPRVEGASEGALTGAFSLSGVPISHSFSNKLSFSLWVGAICSFKQVIVFAFCEDDYVAFLFKKDDNVGI